VQNGYDHSLYEFDSAETGDVNYRLEKGALSTGWFEARRLSLPWLPGYAWKKLRHHSHWRADHTALLTPPSCLLSYHRPCAQMLEQVKASVASQHLTVLVTHWWEYFRDGKPDNEFIAVLHQTALSLANQADVKVVSFDDRVENRIPLN
jgi:hypothetical protein